ncbi:MAG: tetratricopeptide repeat protein [Methylacidiphilales bacterium]|nr:tetratricopeptide repeat protein [Candidatus Methylacidiphilales bacterium]
MKRINPSSLALVLCIPILAQFSTFASEPSVPEDSYQEAFAVFKAGQLNEALQRVDALLAKTPAEARTLELKGRILLGLGKYQQAQDFFFNAIDKNPEQYSAHFYLGESAFRLEHWGEAVQYYKIYLNKVPTGKLAVLKMIYCHLASRNLTDAAKWITTLDPVDELHPYYYFARAALAYSTGKTSEYQEALQQARTIYGNDVYTELEPDLLFVLKKIKANNTPAP